MHSSFRYIVLFCLFCSMANISVAQNKESAANRSGLMNIIYFFVNSKTDYPKEAIAPEKIKLPKDGDSSLPKRAPQDRILDYIWSSQREEGYTRFEKMDDSTYLARLVWVPEDHYLDGKPPVDFRNPNKSLRNRPVIGLIYTQGMVYRDGIWYTKKLYHPNFGITATKGLLFFNEDGNLVMRGFLLGFSATECYIPVDFTPTI